MLPILAVIAGAASAVSAGQAALIGASVGAAAVAGTSVLQNRRQNRKDAEADAKAYDDESGFDDELVEAVIDAALEKIKKRKRRR